jgi:hypothetical protein
MRLRLGCLYLLLASLKLANPQITGGFGESGRLGDLIDSSSGWARTRGLSAARITGIRGWPVR